MTYWDRTKPAKRRSKFDPYLGEIQRRLSEGYSLEQIAEGLWIDYQVGDLEKKGPSSKQVLSAYLARRKHQGALPPAEVGGGVKVTAPGPAAPASETREPAQPVPPPLDVAEALDATKRDERAKSYVADAPTNPFFKRKTK